MTCAAIVPRAAVSLAVVALCRLAGASEMSDVMQMDDAHPFGTVKFDQLEWRNTDRGAASVWDGEAWYGGDYNKVLVRSEGERLTGTTSSASVELLWDRIVSRWWSLQAGARNDFGEGPSRSWAALGLEGTAPYGFETQATVYFGEQGRAAVRLKTEYDLYLTQRLIARPKIEANFYSKADPLRRIGAGLSDLELGLRVRYEIRREFAPYVGLNWARLFGTTSDLARASGQGAGDLEFVAGLKIWF